MHAFDVLGNPVRRRILELLAAGEHSSGEIVERVQREFDISQPAVSQHLKVLRESGFATVRTEGPRRGPESIRRSGRVAGAFPSAVDREAGRVGDRDRARKAGAPHSRGRVAQRSI